MSEPKAAAPTKAIEPPQYELTEPAFINEQRHEAGAAVYYRGIPGPHMIPLNDAAKAMCEKHAKHMHASDPFSSLTVINEKSETLTATHNQ